MPLVSSVLAGTSNQGLELTACTSAYVSHRSRQQGHKGMISRLARYKLGALDISI